MKYNDEAIYELILDKTKNLLNTRGVKGWSMDKLAKDSGLAKNTLYKIIESKENAIISVILRDILRVQEGIQIFVQEDIEAPLDGSKIIDLFAELFLHNHGSYLNDVIIEFPSSKGKIYGYMDKIQGMVVQLLDDMKKNHIIREDCDPVIIFECLRSISIEFIRLGYSGEAFARRVRISYKYLLDGIRR